ncbi:MAG TPA: hypothetical protein VN688_30975 [Gemmataceae bacterium]|nr:hypothetical protein [Gemmataceae bacterium]
MAEEKLQDPLFSVEFALIVVGEGLTAHCCFSDRTQVRIQPGDAIEFIRPDGSVLQTTAQSVKLFESIGMFENGRPGLAGLVLPNGVQKDDIPQGTMLRLIQAGKSCGS